MCLPASARTKVYAALWLFCGMFLNPTSFVPSTVHEDKVPLDGVPSTGVVSVGEVSVLLVNVSVPVWVAILAAAKVDAPVPPFVTDNMPLIFVLATETILSFVIELEGKEFATSIPVVLAKNSVAPVLLLILKLLSESSVIELIVIEPAILSILQSHDTGG